MSALFSKATLPILAAATLFLGLAVIVFLVVSRIDNMVDEAKAAAIAGRDAYWTAEIERTNAETNKRIADQALAALAIETEANARVRAVEAQLSEMETANAALPAGDACGLGRDRVRLLPQ